MSKRSSKQSSSSPVVRFLKEWGLFSIIVGLIIASRIYLWAPVKVDGHSMDPTLADSEYLLVVNHLNLGIFSVEPFGLLVVGHDEYLAYPWCIHLYRAQTVFQFAAVSISALAVFLSFCGSSDARIALSLPLRVVAINP